MSILLPFGILYGWIIGLRNYFYDRGIFKVHDLGARTISIGNLTTGGTGKTPLVALVAEILADNGERVCILTRGYGRKNADAQVLVSDGAKVLAGADTGGDEPVELAHKLIGKAIIIANADRIAAAKWARENFPVTTFILDDGFQHRRAKRDLDIVCIDATDPCGNGRIIPAGVLRESMRGLIRADAVVVTRSDQATDLDSLEARLRRRNDEITLFRSATEFTSFVSIDSFPARTPSIQVDLPEDVLAFTGIGNPQNFFKGLSSAGISLVSTHQLTNHFKYRQKDIEFIEALAVSKDARTLVTTAKDAVKLVGLRFTMPCYVAMARTVMESEAEFRSLITASS